MSASVQCVATRDEVDAVIVGPDEVLDGTDAREQQGGQPGTMDHGGGPLRSIPSRCGDRARRSDCRPPGRRHGRPRWRRHRPRRAPRAIAATSSRPYRWRMACIRPAASRPGCTPPARSRCHLGRAPSGQPLPDPQGSRGHDVKVPALRGEVVPGAGDFEEDEIFQRAVAGRSALGCGAGRNHRAGDLHRIA